MNSKLPYRSIYDKLGTFRGLYYPELEMFVVKRRFSRKYYAARKSYPLNISDWRFAKLCGALLFAVEERGTMDLWVCRVDKLDKIMKQLNYQVTHFSPSMYDFVRFVNPRRKFDTSILLKEKVKLIKTTKVSRYWQEYITSLIQEKWRWKRPQWRYRIGSGSTPSSQDQNATSSSQ